MSVRHDQVVDVTIRRIDLRFNGRYRIFGTTSVAGTPDVPVSRLVVLCDKKTKLPVSQKVSDAGGEYEFQPMAQGPWFVVAFDHTGEYNAVIADNIYGTAI